MSKKEKLKNAINELSKIDIDNKTFNFWKKTFKVYIDEQSENLVSSNIDYLKNKHGLKNETKP